MMVWITIMLSLLISTASAQQPTPQGGPPPPECSLSAPASVSQGMTFTLSWTSSRANRGFYLTAINEQQMSTPMGELIPADSGTMTLTASETLTYAGIVHDNKSQTGACAAKVAVTPKPPEPVKPTCTLAVKPSSVKLGDVGILDWTTSGATRFTVIPLDAKGQPTAPAEDMAPVAGGSTTVYPKVSTQYSGQAIGTNAYADCLSGFIAVEQPPDPGTSYILDDSGAILTADWIPPCVPPDSGEWSCAISPYPQGERLTDLQIVQLPVPGPPVDQRKVRGIADIIALPDGRGCMMTLTGPSLQNPAQWTPVNPAQPECQ